MPIKIIDHKSPEYEKMVDLRRQILRKPLDLDFTKEELDQEENNILIALFEEDEILGCCMLTKIDPDTIKLRQMAIKSGLQGKGVGRVMMQFAENIARDRGYRKMTMHARRTAIGFYEKLGYKVDGHEFEEVTVPHFVMEKPL